MTSIFYIFKSIFYLLLVILAANYTLKYLQKQTTKNTKNIKILERMPVNKNSSIDIVLICGKYYLMSFTENKNEILKELTIIEIELLEQQLLETAELKTQAVSNWQNRYKELLEKVKGYVGKRK